MARKKYAGKRKRTRRRTRIGARRRRYNTRNVVTIVPARGAIMPQRLRTKLTWNRRVALSITSGVTSGNIFFLNSLYDPDSTGVGNQPMGFDEWSALYQVYRVYGAKVNVKFISSAGTGAQNAIEIGMCPTTESVAITTDPQVLGANPGGRFKILYGTQTVGKSNQLTAYYDIARTMGISKITYVGSNDYAALTNGNPSSPLYLNVGSQPVDESSSNSVYMYVSITFYVTFERPQTLAFS